MIPVRADGIAVYVHRTRHGVLELLQLQRSASVGEYQHTWQTVYGGTHDGETAVQACVRELREETGLAPRAMFQVEYLETFYFRPHNYVLLMPVFAVEVNPDDAVTLNDEHIAHRWVPAAEYEQHFMWRTQREAIRYLLDELLHPTAARVMLQVDLPREAARS